MGQSSCIDYVGVVSLIVFLLTVANGQESADNDEGMKCYKPPPLATNTGDHQELFEFAVMVGTPSSSISGLEIKAVVESQSLKISEQCGISSYIVVRSSVIAVQLNLDCKYNTPVQTPIPKTHSVNTSYFANGTTLIKGRVDFKGIVASDVELNGTCQVILPQDTGILAGLPNITLNFYLKLLGCPHGLYGIHCAEQSACSEGVECHPFTGACICPKGLQGESCNSTNPLVLTEATTVFVPFGETVDLICVVYGMYNPFLMQWEKGGSRLASENIRENVRYSPSPIRMITKVQASTAAVDGVYTCIVEITTEFVYRRDVNLIVTDIPQPFLNAPVNQTIVHKQGATFRCQTKPEAGALTWVIGNHTVLSNVTSTGPYLVERGPNDVSLVFDEVRFEDAGMYRCIVGHSGANDSAMSDAWLTVHSRGKKPFITYLIRSGLPDDTLRLSEDEEVFLICEVNEVYPEPVISWLLGNESLTANPPTISVSDDGVSLTVRSLLTLKPTWEDNGKTLVCLSKVPDFNEDQSRVLSLEISYAPKVTITPKGKTFQPGTSPMFKCSALANPSTNMTYKWLLIEQNKTVVKNFNGSDSVQIRDLKPSHNKASLTCTVSNDIGKKSDRAVIKVFGTTSNAGILKYTVMSLALTAVVILIVAMPVIIFKHRTKINELFFNRHQKLAGDKLHDIFIAYKGGGEEEDFIRLSLIPKLEEWGCDVCIHYKNFKPGAEITENIQTAVSTSRKTILVLSPDFMESEWCYYEFLCAMDEMLRDQTDIIPLMFQDIEQLELCESMRHLLQTVSYVPWLGGGGGQGQGQAERFWKPLKRAVETHLNVNRVGGAEDIEDRNNDDVLNDDEMDLIP